MLKLKYKFGYDSISVSISPPIVNPGDTTQILIKRRNPDGTLADFDSTQTFEIAKLQGCMLGNLMVGSDSGSYFYDVHQPIYFVAADSVSGDTTQDVHIRVGLVYNQKSKAKYNLNNIENDECFIGNFNSSTFRDKTFSVGSEIELLSYANGEPNNWIEGNDPTMPEFPIELKITNNDEGGLLIYQLFVSWKCTELAGQPEFVGLAKDILVVNPDLPTVNFDIAWHYLGENVIVGGNDLTLRIDYKDVKTKFKLNTVILGHNPDKQTIKEFIANQQFPEIDLPLSGTVTEDDQILQMQILVMKESTWFHFKDERDEFHNYPADEWGYNNMNPNPHDWGLSQLSIAEPSLGVIWNWKVNINAGIHHLWSEKYPIAKRLFRTIKTKFKRDGEVIRDPNREEFLTMLAQLYKGGAYYDSFQFTKGTNGKYDRKKEIKAIDYGYGYDFWEKFDDVHNGPPNPKAPEW